MYIPRILPLPPPAFNGGLDDNSGESANNAALLLWSWGVIKPPFGSTSLISEEVDTYIKSRFFWRKKYYNYAYFIFCKLNKFLNCEIILNFSFKTWLDLSITYIGGRNWGRCCNCWCLLIQKAHGSTSNLKITYYDKHFQNRILFFWNW